MFLVFIGDLADGVEALVLIYKDDSKVKCPLKYEGVGLLQADLNRIYTGEEQNNMCFTGDKFQLLCYGRNQELKDNTCYFTRNMNKVIEQVSSVRDLGVTLTDATKFEEHIKNIFKRKADRSQDGSSEHSSLGNQRL